MLEKNFAASGISSGFPVAFSTTAPTNFLTGVIVQGARCGVVGEGLQAEFMYQ